MNSKKTDLEFNNYLPHNFLAEKMVLSCMLISSQAIEKIIISLPIGSFYFKNHQELFKAILVMYQMKQSIDIITLTNFLQENGLINKIGGIKVLIELINQIPNLVYLNDYIKLMKDKFLRRLLIKIGYKTINSSYITNLPLETILNEFGEELFYLKSKFTYENIATNAELIYDIFLELKQNAIKPNLSGLTSGFYDLDTLTQGFQKSDLIILAGRPSIGKTAFSLTIALNILNSSNLPIIFFSLEMSKEQIMYRLIAMETNISQFRLKSGKLYKNDWNNLNKTFNTLSKLLLFIEDNSNISIQDIRMKIKTILFQYKKIGLIIIDYLQLMENPSFKNGTRVQELSQITRRLKNIAQEFNIPIIALSQLSRNVENRNDKKPILSDLRESGSIEQDADLVLMLYENNRNNIKKVPTNRIKTIDLFIAKQRNGPIGNVQLTFDKNRTKYYNIESKI